MRDSISENRVALLHPAIRSEVKKLIEEAEAQLPHTAIRVVQGLRTFAEQDKLYAQGRTTEGKIVTNAKGGQSNHCYGLSLDFALMYDKDGNGTYEVISWSTGEDFDNDKHADWMEVVKIFQFNGYTWGGDWKFRDYPHLEKTFGLGWRELLQRHNDKWFIPNTTYVQLP